MACGRSTPSRLATRWKNSSRLNGSLPSGCSKCRSSSGGSWAAGLSLSPRPAARPAWPGWPVRRHRGELSRARAWSCPMNSSCCIAETSLAIVRRSGAVDQAVIALLLGAAEDAAVGLDAVADDPAAAAVAGGYDGMDGAFEAVEGVGVPATMTWNALS